MGQFKEEFPCGYKREGKSIFLRYEDSKEEPHRGCPIHGKDCKKQ